MSATTTLTSLIPAGTYNVDPSHSNVGFEVRHMGIATVRGTFHTFAGTLDATGDAPNLAGESRSQASTPATRSATRT